MGQYASEKASIVCTACTGTACGACPPGRFDAPIRSSGLCGSTNTIGSAALCQTKAARLGLSPTFVGTESDLTFPSGCYAFHNKSGGGALGGVYYNAAPSTRPCTEHGRCLCGDPSGTCSDCPAGKWQNATGAATCIACEPGKASTAARSSAPCAPCVAGRYSSPDRSRCLECPAGKWQNETGAAVCNTCDVGKVSLVAAATSKGAKALPAVTS